MITVVKRGDLTLEFYEVLKKYIMALTPGNCAQALTVAEYRNVHRPMEPLIRFLPEKKDRNV